MADMLFDNVYTNGSREENGPAHVNGVRRPVSNSITNPISPPLTNPTPPLTPKAGTWISERCTDQPRPLKLIYIGAGVSGIVGAIEFLKQVPELQLVIYEKNPEVGGTWFENKYPGCACDVPAHVYQLSSESWPRWSQFFAQAPEILEYWQRVASKYGVKRHIRFEQKCLGARWSETAGKWFVQIRDLKSGQVHEDSADVFMTGEGVLNEWKWPQIDGLAEFRGTLVHSANWDPQTVLKDKKVAVIGAGSSGIQIVPAIVGEVRSLDHYVRGRTWIAEQFDDDPALLARSQAEGGNFSYTEAEKQLWEHDRAAYLQYRRTLERDTIKKFGVVFSGSKEQAAARSRCHASMRSKLQAKPAVFDNILPSFSPYCKRMTPGPGYLEALASPKVDTIAARIREINERGIVTADDVHRPVDVIICATGFHTEPGGRGFPIYGQHGVNLRERYARRPETYLSLCTDGFPNFFQSLGPNSLPGAGSLLLVIEKVHAYVGSILARMAYENVGRVQPKLRAVEAFTSYCDEFFKRTVFSEECNSWYKTAAAGATREEQKRGRVTALWPGSALQCVRALRSVRWEDFDVRAYDDNEFGWFGNGWTVAEKDTICDTEALTWYLDDTNILEP